MVSTQVVKTSVNVTDNSPPQDSSHQEDHNGQKYYISHLQIIWGCGSVVVSVLDFDSDLMLGVWHPVPATLLFP